MKTKKPKTVYCLYVNLTSNYVSFKIEKGKFLGELNNKAIGKGYYVVEHEDDEVNYLQKVDIFDSEAKAFGGLVKILNNKLNK